MSDYRDELKKHFKFHGEVDQCPICHNKIMPILLFVRNRGYTYGSLYNVNQVLFECPNSRCKEVFIAYYRKDDSIFNDLYTLSQVRPHNFIDEDFDKEITNISPMFCKIYNQAYKAEQMKLKEICGMGYRKSFEFLIKDYLIKILPEEKVADIEKVPLGNCIKNYITDQRIKSNAERAVWLGNDETHYVRVYEEFDIEDIKKLIQLTVFYIQSEILSGEYEDKLKKK